MGMLRLKDETALNDLLKASNLRLAHDTAARPGKPKSTFSPLITPAVPQRIRGKRTKAKSEIEEMMALQIITAGLPPHVRQHNYLPDRSFKGDFMWVERKIALEVDGSVHRIKGTFSLSFERAYLLTMAGWTVLHVGGHEVRSGTALEWIKKLLERGAQR